MNRKLWAATAAALAVFLIYLLGIVNIFFSELVLTHWQPLMRDAELPLAILGSLALTAFVIAYIYPKGYEGGAPWLEGARFGLLIGLLVEVAQALFQYHFLALPAAGLFGTALLFVIRDVIAGIAVGLVYGRLPRR